MDALFHVTSQGDNRLVTPIDRYSALRQGAAVIADMALVEYEQAIVESGLTVEHRYVGRVSSNYFDLIGVRPVSGRLFSPATVAMDEGTNVVVSFGLWRDLLGSPSSLSGIAITVKGVSYNVIGVTPPGIGAVDWSNLWLVMRSAETVGTGVRWPSAVVRVREGVTLSALQRDVHRLAGQLTTRFGTGKTAFNFLPRPWRSAPIRWSSTSSTSPSSRPPWPSC